MAAVPDVTLPDFVPLCDHRGQLVYVRLYTVDAIELEGDPIVGNEPAPIVHLSSGQIFQVGQESLDRLLRRLASR